METNEKYLSIFETPLLYSEVVKSVPEEQLNILKEAKVLKYIEPEKLLNASCLTDLGFGLNEYRIVSLSDKLHFLAADYTHEPVELMSEHLFAKLDWNTYAQQIQSANALKIGTPPHSLPAGFCYLGGRTVSDGQSVHIIAKNLIDEKSFEEIKNFLTAYAMGGTNFVILTLDTALLKFKLGDSFNQNLAIGSFPPLEKNFIIDPRTIYKSEFGYSLNQVLNEAPLACIVVDKVSHKISYGRKTIVSGNCNQFKFLEYLIKNPNVNISNEVIAHNLLGNPSHTKASKTVIDLKDKILSKVEVACGDDSALYQVFREAIPQKERGNILLSDSKIHLAVLNVI